jgi:hypothetical protein
MSLVSDIKLIRTDTTLDLTLDCVTLISPNKSYSKLEYNKPSAVYFCSDLPWSMESPEAQYKTPLLQQPQQSYKISSMSLQVIKPKETY